MGKFWQKKSVIPPSQSCFTCVTLYLNQSRLITYCIMYLNYSVCSLTQLEALDLAHNRNLTTLSDRVRDLKSLMKLDVSYCNITQLPDGWVNDLSSHHCWFLYIPSFMVHDTHYYNLINVHVFLDLNLG